MADVDHIKIRFPALHMQIADQRMRDSFLDDICGDLETLAGILDLKGNTLEPGSLQDLRNSIRGLETEILTHVTKSLKQSEEADHNEI